MCTKLILSKSPKIEDKFDKKLHLHYHSVALDFSILPFLLSGIVDCLLHFQFVRSQGKFLESNGKPLEADRNSMEAFV